MTDTNALATMPAPQPTIDDREQYSLLMTQAKHAIDSGLLPAGIKTPQQALVILRKGRELGVPDMYALSNIAVVNGKPTAMAELMLALVYRAYGGNSIRVIETSSERAVVRYQRPEWDEPSTLEFTIGEAETAGLLKKGGPWMQYPAAMLRWRAVSAAAKLGFPEILAGLYTPEELGAPVVIEPSGEAWIDTNAAEPEGRIVDPETGEILDAESQPAPQPSAAAEEPPKPGRGRAKLLESVMALCEELAPLRGKREDKFKVLRAACNANEIAAEKPADLTVPQLSTLLNWLTTQRDIYRNSQEPIGSDEEPASQDLY